MHTATQVDVVNLAIGAGAHGHFDFPAFPHAHGDVFVSSPGNAAFGLDGIDLRLRYAQQEDPLTFTRDGPDVEHGRRLVLHAAHEADGAQTLETAGRHG